MRIKLLFAFLAFEFLGFAQIDTVTVKNLLKEANDLRFSDPDKSSKLYKRTIKFSDSIHYLLAMHNANIGLGILSYDAGKYDESIEYYQKALKIAESIDYIKGMGNSCLDIAISLYFRGESIKATQEYLKSLDYFLKEKDTFAIITVYQNVGLIFSDLEQYEKSNYYVKKSLELSIKFKDSIKIGANSLNLGMNYAKTRQHEKAFQQFMFVKPIVEAVNNPQLSYYLYQNLAQHYLDTSEPEKALENAQKAYEFIKPIDSKIDISYIFDLTGNIYRELGNYDLAQDYYLKAYNLGEEIQVPDLLINSSLSLSELYEAKKQFPLAYKYAKNYIILYDSIRGEKNQKLIAGIEAQYEFEKKNNEILKQKLTIEQNEAILQKKINQSGLYLVGLGILLFTSFLFWYRHKQKQKLHIQTLKTLNKEKELASLEALIEGEDKERSRIAKDLHDSVNGNLSAIKHNLSSISHNNFKTDDNEIFNNAIEMLDNACEQIRNISHDLVPPSLLNYGFIEALEQYIIRINSLGLVEISFQHFGSLYPMTKKTETMIYHTIQELIANIVKHSKAKKALVQINTKLNLLHITVEDDGIGYDINEVSHGLGLQNIKSRVEFLDAEMDVKSDKKGTSVTIDISLPKQSKS